MPRILMQLIFSLRKSDIFSLLLYLKIDSILEMYLMSYSMQIKGCPRYYVIAISVIVDNILNL